MRKIMFATILTVLMAFSTSFAAENVNSPPIISVNGDGFVEMTPDRAKISIGVVTNAKNPSEAQNLNAQAAKSVIDSIIGLGIERKNVSTSNFSIYPTRNGVKNEISGYEATNLVTITVDDVNLVGKIIDSALKSGANHVDGVNFGLRDKNSAQDEAIRLAILDAKHKAEVAAAVLGKKIVGVRNISLNSSSISPRNYKMARAAADSADFETPIESGTVNFTAYVHVEFEIG